MSVGAGETVDTGQSGGDDMIDAGEARLLHKISRGGVHLGPY